MDLSAPWMVVDPAKLEGEFKTLPDRNELPSDINENLIVELYSQECPASSPASSGRRQHQGHICEVTHDGCD
jgi:hypothetical protein